MARDAVGQRLLAGRVRRRDLRVRRRAVPRLDGRSPPQPADGRDGADADRARLLAGRSPTAASSRSATRAFHGSTGNIRLVSPIVGMEGRTAGYRFVAGDGGVFTFGLPFSGSAAGLTTARPRSRSPTTERRRRSSVRRRRRVSARPTRRRSRSRTCPARGTPARRVDRRAERDAVEAAADRDAPHARGAELGDRRGARQREDVDREVDRGDERADVVEVLQSRRVQHVGARRLIRLEPRDRVGEIGAAVQVVLGARGEHEVHSAAVRGFGRGRDPLGRGRDARRSGRRRAAVKSSTEHAGHARSPRCRATLAATPAGRRRTRSRSRR